MSHSISVAILQVILPFLRVHDTCCRDSGIIPHDSSIVKIGVSLLILPSGSSETAILLVSSLILPGTEKQEHKSKHEHESQRKLR